MASKCYLEDLSGVGLQFPLHEVVSEATEAMQQFIHAGAAEQCGAAITKYPIVDVLIELYAEVTLIINFLDSALRCIW